MATIKQLQEQVNQTIIEALRAETIPWRSDHGFPRNALSRQRYGGIEAIQLMIACERQGFTSGLWGMKSEWEALGGKVLPGMAATHIVVPSGSLLQSFSVYNLCQVSGEFSMSRKEHRMADYTLAERIIANTGADIRFTDEAIAVYDYSGDFIEMCRKERFVRGRGRVQAFYHILLHELAHWSEPGTRCGWRGSREVNELRADMVAGFLTSELVIPDYPYAGHKNVHTYRDAWIEEMQRRPGMIFQVAASAAQAVDYLLSFTGQVGPRHQEAA